MTLAGPLHPAHAMKRLSPAKLRRHLDRLEQSLPAALVRRFAEADLMTQAASLSFYTLLSLARGGRWPQLGPPCVAAA